MSYLEMSEKDLVRDLLIKRAEATMSADFRKKYGSSELMLVAASGVELIRDVLKTTNVLHLGVIALAKQSAVAKIALNIPSPLDEAAGEILRRDVAAGEQLGPQAKAFVDDDFGPLNAITLVSLCAAVEVSLEDTIRAALRFTPGIVDRLQRIGVKKLDGFKKGDLTYDEACIALRQLKYWARDDASVPDGVLRMLKAVGIDIDVEEGDKKALREMIYVRNCILHRGHRADGRSSMEAADLELEIGVRFRVSRKSMGKYCNASLALVSDVALFLTASGGQLTVEGLS